MSLKKEGLTMGLDPFKKNSKVGIALITASCCFPGMAPFEEQARCVIEQAISETGVEAQIKTLPVSSYYNSVSREITAKWLADYNLGKISAPAIIIEGKIAFYGVPGLAEMKTALVQAAEAKKMKEESAGEPKPKSVNIA
jgi:hypothetical protein